MYLVKDTPILKNKKLFTVGEKFPYSEKEDKHLLWNLTLVKEDGPKAKSVSVTDETSLQAETKKVSAAKTKKKKTVSK